MRPNDRRAEKDKKKRKEKITLQASGRSAPCDLLDQLARDGKGRGERKDEARATHARQKHAATTRATSITAHLTLLALQ
jgi:hypothetical protein